MNKKLILGIVILVIVVIGAWFIFKPATPVDTTPSVVEGIIVDMPKENGTVGSGTVISGSVTGSGWTGFEGQVGTVHLLDSAGKELAVAPLTASTDWMKLPTKFETSLFFDFPGEGVGTLVFKNENASGEAERNKSFSLPVKITKSSALTSTVKAYFSNNELDPKISCTAVFPVERKIPKTEALAKASLEELLQGPKGLDGAAGFYTSINSGVKIQSIVIVGTVAKVDFNEELQKGVAGSCKVTAIKAQITKTLLQFPTVKSVVISINGKTDDILQP